MTYRTLIENPEFTQKIATLYDDQVQLDEWLEGWKLVLSGMPEWGRKITGHELWMLNADVEPIATGVVIYYTFDDETVKLHDAFFYPI